MSLIVNAPSGNELIDSVNTLDIDKQNTLTENQLAAVNSGITSELVEQIGTNQTNISNVQSLIPSQATSSNQLADKNFVNSSIQTATAEFDGSWETYASIPSTTAGFTDLGLPAPTKNNYLVVRADETQDGGTWRYKYVEGSSSTYSKSNWHAEYEVNETPLTAAQLAALNSGITSSGVSQIQQNTSDISDIQTELDNNYAKLDQDNVFSGVNTSDGIDIAPTSGASIRFLSQTEDAPAEIYISSNNPDLVISNPDGDLILSTENGSVIVPTPTQDTMDSQQVDTVGARKTAVQTLDGGISNCIIEEQKRLTFAIGDQDYSYHYITFGNLRGLKLKSGSKLVSAVDEFETTQDIMIFNSTPPSSLRGKNFFVFIDGNQQVVPITSLMDVTKSCAVEEIADADATVYGICLEIRSGRIYQSQSGSWSLTDWYYPIGVFNLDLKDVITVATGKYTNEANLFNSYSFIGSAAIIYSGLKILIPDGKEGGKYKSAIAEIQDTTIVSLWSSDYPDPNIYINKAGQLSASTRNYRFDIKAFTEKELVEVFHAFDSSSNVVCYCYETNRYHEDMGGLPDMGFILRAEIDDDSHAILNVSTQERSSGFVTASSLNLALMSKALVNTAIGGNSLTIYGEPALDDNVISIGFDSSKAVEGAVCIGSYQNLGSTCESIVALGNNINARGPDGVAIGAYTTIKEASIAIGNNASANALYSIQLGHGTNSEANSFYVATSSSSNWKMLDNTGKIPEARIPSTIARSSDIITYTAGSGINISASHSISIDTSGGGFLTNIGTGTNVLGVGGTSVSGTNVTAVGQANEINGSNCTILGYDNSSLVSLRNVISIGNTNDFGSTGAPHNLTVIGNQNTIKSSGLIVIGDYNSSTINQSINSIILGSRFADNNIEGGSLLVSSPDPNVTGDHYKLLDLGSGLIPLERMPYTLTSNGNMVIGYNDDGSASNCIILGYGTSSLNPSEYKFLVTGGSTNSIYELLDLNTGKIPADRLPSSGSGLENLSTDSTSLGILSSTDSPYTTIIGYNNDTNAGTDGALITLGANNLMRGTYDSIIIGNENCLSSDGTHDNIIIGHDNGAGAAHIQRDNIIIGNSTLTTAPCNIIIGNGAGLDSGCHNTILLGTANFDFDSNSFYVAKPLSILEASQGVAYKLLDLTTGTIPAERLNLTDSRRNVMIGGGKITNNQAEQCLLFGNVDVNLSTDNIFYVSLAGSNADYIYPMLDLTTGKIPAARIPNDVVLQNLATPNTNSLAILTDPYDEYYTYSHLTVVGSNNHLDGERSNTIILGSSNGSEYGNHIMIGMLNIASGTSYCEDNILIGYSNNFSDTTDVIAVGKNIGGNSSWGEKSTFIGHNLSKLSGNNIIIGEDINVNRGDNNVIISNGTKNPVLAFPSSTVMTGTIFIANKLPSELANTGTALSNKFIVGGSTNMTDSYVMLDLSTGKIPEARIPTLSSYVTLDTTQNITGEKTFVGEKRIKFKQSANGNKLGFTLYTSTGTEKGYLEFNPNNLVDNVPLMALGNYASAAAGLTHVGFRKYSSISGADGAYNLLTPLISDARTPFSLVKENYTNFYFPLGFTDGTTTVQTAKTGVVDLSPIIPNIVSSVSSSSTNSEAVGAKLFYDTIGDIATALHNINSGS